MKNIVLASRSPRRKQLLEWAEMEFDVLVKETDETYPDHLNILDVPVYIAHQKALAVQDSPIFKRYEGNSIIIAADTVVVLENRIIGKPSDRDDAIHILSDLSGKKHQVITGVVILSGKQEISFSDTTIVSFHELTADQIEYYVDNYLPYDKAGAYAIQEWIGVVGIKCIEGDFYNVMGLPVSRVIKELDKIIKQV